MAYDILIQGGTIIDGTGKPRVLGDVGIQEGRIKDIGAPTLSGATAGKIVNAVGKFVTPGFIDITSHADANWSIFQNPEQDYLLTQGVTSILIGNCGSSLAPLLSPQALESLRKWDNISEPNINWATVAEFFGELGRHPLGVNIATLMGHGTIRRGLLKGEARTMTDVELRQFADVIEQGIKDGAFGISTGLIYSHEASATVEELSAIATIAARLGGIYKTHLRHEGRNLIPAMNEAIQIGRTSGARVIISHLKAIGRRSWSSFGDAMTMMDHANEEKPMFYFDIAPYQRTGSFLYLLLPAFARSGGFSQMLDRLETPTTRSEIVADLKRATLHYDRYIVANSVTPGSNGLTIADISEKAGEAPEEIILSLLAASRGKVSVFGKTLSLKNIEAGLTHPLSMVASDGSGVSGELGKAGVLVHPRSTGAFPHFLHRFIREKQIVSWEEGIRKITSLPAEVVGFKERGEIKAGNWADIAVFDPEVIRDRSTYHNPYVHPVGIEAVVVGGKLAIEGGELTGSASGQVLKKS